MTNAKMKVSKEVAEALDGLLKKGNTPETIENILSCHVKHRWSGYKQLNGVSLYTLSSALINGYEIEQTPAEKVAFYYETERLLSRTTLGYERAISIGAMRGIEFVAKAYGLKIEGVNV